MENFNDEINTMNKFLAGSDNDNDNDVVTDDPSTEVPTTETSVTDSPVTENPSTEVPTTNEPSTDAPSTDAPDDVITSLKAEIEELKSLIKSNHKPSTEAPSTEAPIAIENKNFIEDIDTEELSEDPEKLNELLNKVYQQAITDTRKVLGESILRSIPDIVKTNIAVISNLQKASEQFYEQNQDLKPFKKVVASVFEELASKNPDKQYNEILEIVGDEVRKRLDLHKKAVNKTNNKKSPRLPRKRSSAKTKHVKPEVEPLLSELEEMNKVLGR